MVANESQAKMDTFMPDYKVGQYRQLYEPAWATIRKLSLVRLC